MGRTTTTSSDHFGWVVLLLAAAVILPTVCLLWFMTTAIRNERLVMRQRMEGIYQNRLKASVREKLDVDIGGHIALVFSDGFLVYDKNGKMTFPVADVEDENLNNNEFALAFQLEYKNADPNKAFDEYRRIAKAAERESLRIDTEISQARCLRKMNRTDEAIQLLRTILSRYNNGEAYLRVAKGRAYLLLLELGRQANDNNFNNDLSSAFDYALSGMARDDDFAVLGREPNVREYIPSSLQVFMLQKCVDDANNLNDPSLEKKCKRAMWLIDTVSTSIQTAQRYPTPEFADPNPQILNSRVIRLDTREPLYGIYQRGKDHLTLMIFSHCSGWFNSFIEDMQQLPANPRFYDPAGKSYQNAPPPPNQKLFVKTTLQDGYLAGWTIELYIDDSVFDSAAARQRLTYIWSVVLVIVLMVVFASLAGREVLHQARLNRIKNNFVATVTHELKTPLSSMRLLVDTLLDGNYTNQQQCKEYLELISHENERLSRMIESFLTFSRMERNKQVFDFQPVNPADIVHAAAQAVQTKMNQPGCHFTASADNALPQVRADKDAMITVLINLLDNAYKYSNPEKTIELSAYRENEKVCFAVKDNGIGIPRRLQKRIFDRFFQADSRLSRSAEGCGLGLSIVKFIVNAHKGTIEVESKIGNGSVFIIKIPTVIG